MADWVWGSFVSCTVTGQWTSGDCAGWRRPAFCNQPSVNENSVWNSTRQKAQETVWQIKFKNQALAPYVIPVISKRGKSDLRYGLYQAALVASTRDPHFIKYFTEKIRGREKEKGIKIKMRVKLAAKMLVIAWTLMKNKEPFNPDYLKIE